jgi:hypothetical protein
MITIKLAGENRNQNLIRPDSDAGWMRTPIGMAGKLGSGPANTVCRGCIHLDLAASVWSDRGKAAPCLERLRLAGGKGQIQPVPANSASCSRYVERPDIGTAIASAEERLGERIRVKRDQLENLRQASKRLETDIRELQKLREDPGVDAAWANAEPMEPGG